jgi:hypothetical protein
VQRASARVFTMSSTQAAVCVSNACVAICSAICSADITQAQSYGSEAGRLAILSSVPYRWFPSVAVEGRKGVGSVRGHVIPGKSFLTMPMPCWRKQDPYRCCTLTWTLILGFASMRALRMPSLDSERHMCRKTAT